MKTKLYKSGGVILAATLLTGCGFIESAPEPEQTQVEETPQEQEPPGEVNLFEGEDINTEGKDLTDVLQTDGKIIFKPSFTKTETGGVDTILLEPGASEEQIKFLQNRMLANSQMQSNGLAQDPIGIYGDAAPGIKIMSENRDKYETSYKELPLGGSIEYTTTDPLVLEAIHDWIDYSNSAFTEDDYTPPIE